MIQRQGDAIVLRVWPFQEAGLLGSLFTRGQGGVRGGARPSMRARRGCGGGLVPMRYVRGWDAVGRGQGGVAVGALGGVGVGRWGGVGWEGRWGYWGGGGGRWRRGRGGRGGGPICGGLRWRRWSGIWSGGW